MDQCWTDEGEDSCVCGTGPSMSGTLKSPGYHVQGQAGAGHPWDEPCRIGTRRDETGSGDMKRPSIAACGDPFIHPNLAHTAARQPTTRTVHSARNGWGTQSGPIGRAGLHRPSNDQSYYVYGAAYGRSRTGGTKRTNSVGLSSGSSFRLPGHPVRTPLRLQVVGKYES